MNFNIRNTLGPLFLILVCPVFVMLMWYTNTQLEGSLLALWNLMLQNGFSQSIYSIWQPYFWGSTIAWKIIVVFIVFELALMRLLPGKIFHGPISPKGNVPVYKDNGLFAFIVTMGTFCVSSFGFNLFSASILYDNLGALLGALNIFSLIFCAFLYLKGRFFPSSTDSGITRNFLFDYYWGTELYPQVFGWHIKKFITCRFGMMSWGLFLISYCAKQAELGGVSNSMLISVFLQFVYLSKFYMWEKGYLRSLDMMHDRAGFYICWGCMVWVPCVYTSPSMYLVLHPIHLPFIWAIVILFLGFASIMINFLADRQRLTARATQGDCSIWGKKPVTVLAHYKTTEGDKKQTILLASGWWGVARHFHYIPELAGTFFWSVPALFVNFSPYFYLSFLTVLLFDRAFRDDRRCATKYGQDWKKYCELVPYKIVPFLI
ncbi:7-dehydrocholesterol reductase [Legionella longbeachae]|nr:7-dehydrocholesterol reductase [Legionella longbeachae]VEE02182.1 7-dehydrocholesterol reductase (7-DHC reductase) (Sterol Delta(7)-reductase) (protein DWARF 5) [Legionella oakridgensis]HBD7396576.1 7-dehydrocholesterol reductase [Legionella pneumophila]ARB91516.1 7-dehydrocholesterol reductase [Legionella longbeachae]QIN32063.1 7-dehydrocholesterol reductase [Legionella longbeachae]QIN35409.1 7-dehydrocholesterol reductase [Legionella longbeachae]